MRTNHQNTGGYGEIAQLTFTISPTAPAGMKLMSVPFNAYAIMADESTVALQLAGDTATVYEPVGVDNEWILVNL